MKKQVRYNVVKAMDTIARCINNEDIFEDWLIYGVADGDTEPDGDLDIYIEDKHYSELISLFLRLMARARKNGGLYSDGVVDEDP